MVSDAGLHVEGMSVSYDRQLVVSGIDLEVGVGEIVVLLGPSGCGKSTLLRALAGLERLEAGSISWGGEPMNDVPAHQRGFGLMFQHHALFPHRTVAGNVSFGLEMRGDARRTQAVTVAELLALVGLPGFEDRAVSSLSGGEAQRVALARALAPRPRLLLLDEPLASLDRPLRDRLTSDLLRLRDELDLTIIHVTHDRDEAFALADRLALMREGGTVAVGPPEQLWAHPPDEWVARFVGHQNVIPVSSVDGTIQSPIGDLGPADTASAHADHVVLPIDAVHLVDDSSRRATVTSSRFSTRGFEVTVDVDGTQLVATAPSRPSPGDTVGLAVDIHRIVPLPHQQS